MIADPDPAGRPMPARGLVRAAVAVVVLSAATTVAADGLLEAVKARNAATARALIAEATDVNLLDVDGATPLLYATHFADRELVRALLAAGADPSIANRYGLAPIHEAARVADVELLTMLLDAGAEVGHALPEGETPLMLAARTSRADAVRLLIERGANVNVVEHWQGQTPLMYAAALDRADVVAALLEAGADVNATTPLNELPRRVPAARFNVEFPLGGMTALAFAAREGAAAATHLLIEAGADMDHTTPEGFSPLVLAIHNLHYDVAKLLVDAGASFAGGALYTLMDARNRVPLDGPRRSPTGATTELELLDAMLARGVDFDDRPPQPLPDNQPGFGDVPTQPVDLALIRAARSADLESLRRMIAAGADPASAEPTGFNTVIAVTEGPEIPPLVEVDRERPDEPDAIAALEFLIGQGVDLNARGPQGVSAIHTAARRGFREVVRFLAANGADLNATDAGGRTPLDYALGRYQMMFGNPPVHEATAALLRELGGVEGAGQTPPRRQ
jgi:uncharacterized protein